jgi:hypothetical protein
MPTTYEIRDYCDTVYPEGRVVSRHRSEDAAERKLSADLRAVRRLHGEGAYLDRRVVAVEH